MQLLEGRLVYSASDLNAMLECEHLAEVSRRASSGEIATPEADASSQLLSRKGTEHEQRYLDALRARGVEVLVLPERIENRSIDALVAADRATRDAMRNGSRYIYQATFFDGAFLGRADFLRRVDDSNAPSGIRYEVIDTKLARSTKAHFLIQLCAYSEHVARLQEGLMPERMYVALGSGEERAFNPGEYIAYYRRLKRSFLERIGTLSAYPYECSHCAVCAWDSACEARRRSDDDLSLVARMRRDQIAKLHASGITTVTQLAATNGAQEARPHGLAAPTFDALAQQARLQVMQRESIAAGVTGPERYHYELLPFDTARGFALLPQPDEGDLYFDMEGDPYYAPDTGLEYLFGIYVPKEDRYIAFWARSLAEEKRALTEFLTFVLSWRERHPNMHVYHYANYEKAAVGRLTTRYGTLTDEFDDLLRAQVLVDLYTVVRQGLRISQESYSIKKLEPFYEFERTGDLKRGDDSILLFEEWLDSGDDDILEAIRHYNDEDCRSTCHLHRWLIARRAQLQHEQNVEIPWAMPTPAVEPNDEQRAENELVRALRERILAGIDDPGDLHAVRVLPDADRLRWYVGNLLDYHRNEAKPSWWEYFDRCKNADQLAEFDHTCIGDLELRTDIAPYKLRPRDRNVVFTFSFPEQQHNLRAGDQVHDAATESSAGDLIAVDDEQRTVQLKVPGKLDPAKIRALVPQPFTAGPQRKACLSIAQSLDRGTLQNEYPAIVDLLLASTPRMIDRRAGEAIQPESVDGASLASAILALDSSYLVVQGPPGSGKSTTGGDAIARLLLAGKRVGILARSHKAAHNLVAAVEKAARRIGHVFDGAHKFSDDADCYESPFGDESYVANEATADGALGVQHQLVSGTPWLFAREDAVAAFDVLVIDEAGQLAIADAVACARAARNVVLLGDPLQLAQVSQGSHRPGMELSILEHLLGEHATIPADRGIFLPQSWRMHPLICDFISKTVYEGRLHAADGNEANAVTSPGLAGSGLRWRGVEHRNNRRSSEEEADAIVRDVRALIGGSFRVRGKPEQPIAQEHILVVSPYNAQRVLIARRLRDAGFDDIRVGTVDKFQGLEAPVVMYSMATSSGDDLPRDMEFLFEKNRFNVAISRAQCVSVLYCSPRLLEVRCRTPEQMALANLVCAYVEEAQVEPLRRAERV